ncbi:hypothetical protein [Streptomyces sp. NPDC004435]|uniref:hypothetical protein n=1 Tax=Streptomyces sp. NPDC004435 TaxID=3364701 RepID=UPI003685A0EF
MSDTPRRLDPTTDASSAAIILGCEPSRVGPCARCRGLTIRYGGGIPRAMPVCPACQAESEASGTGSAVRSGR